MKIRKAKKPILGVGWYKKEQWSLLRENSEDVDDLENTFYEWVANANDAFKKISKSNNRIEKIEIDVTELIQWCKNEKCTLNAESRSKFIALKTKEKFR